MTTQIPNPSLNCFPAICRRATSGMAIRDGTGLCNRRSDCGELVQGYAAGRDFLVHAHRPVVCATARILTIRRVSKCKVSRARTEGGRRRPIAFDELGLRATGALCVDERRNSSQQGMASSSADIAAAIHACTEAAGVALSAYEICPQRAYRTDRRREYEGSSFSITCKVRSWSRSGLRRRSHASSSTRGYCGDRDL